MIFIKGSKNPLFDLCQYILLQNPTLYIKNKDDFGAHRLCIITYKKYLGELTVQDIKCDKKVKDNILELNHQISVIV